MQVVVIAVVSFLLATVSRSSSITLRDRVLSISRHWSVLSQVLSDINLVDDDGRSALHHAVLLGDVGLVRFFLEQQANAMLVDNEGNLPLYYAEDFAYADVEKNRSDSPYFMITSLLLQHMSGHARRRGEVTRDRNSWNALHWMVLAGDRAGVEELIDNGFDPSYGRYQTPIDIAFMIRDQEMFTLLLTKGMEARKLDLQKFDLFSIMRIMQATSTARGYNSLENWQTLVNWIVDAGLAPPLPHLLPPSNISDDDLVQLMHLAMEHGFDINVRTHRGRTILQQAVNWRRSKTIRFLIEHDVVIDNESVKTAIWDAKTMATLLDCDFDINTVVDEGGVTPLMMAVRFERVDTVRVLKEHGADNAPTNSEGQTALDSAKRELQRIENKHQHEQRRGKLQEIIEILEGRS